MGIGTNIDQFRLLTVDIINAVDAPRVDLMPGDPRLYTF